MPPARLRGHAVTPERPRSGIAALCVTVLVFLLALFAIAGGFVNLDDRLYVSDRPASDGLTAGAIAFAFTSVERLYWHPLAWLSHELDTELFGTVAAGHHLTSVLLHALTAGLLCFLLARLGAGAFPAAAGALLWALHPLRVESFVWVAERKDVLCAFFFVATLLLYLRYVERPSRGRYVAWLVSGALALMSKPTAVSLPAVLLLLDYWPRRRERTLIRLLAEKLPLFAMAAAVTFLTITGQARAGALYNVDAGARAANAVTGYARYLGKMVWPVNLACFYPYDSHTPVLSIVLAASLLAAISALAVLERKRRPYLLFGWLWFLAALLPNAGLIQAGRQSIADRFTHLPMIGMAIAAVWAASEWAEKRPRRRKPAAWAVAGLLAVLALLTVRQIGYWHDSITLAEHAIAVENSDFMRENLAETLLRRGRDAEALVHLRAAVRLAPDRFHHHSNLANALLKTGAVEAAAGEARVALRLAPDSVATTQTMGTVLLRQGDSAGAIAQFDHAIRLGADGVAIAARLNDAGASLASRGRLRDAEPLIRRAVELNPTLVQARRNLVLVLQDQGQTERARASLEQAIQATGPRPEYRDLVRELAASGLR